jgi:hypothetical protein
MPNSSHVNSRIVVPVKKIISPVNSPCKHTISPENNRTVVLVKKIISPVNRPLSALKIIE